MLDIEFCEILFELLTRLIFKPMSCEKTLPFNNSKIMRKANRCLLDIIRRCSALVYTLIFIQMFNSLNYSKIFIIEAAGIDETSV